ncbi:triose-phosphate isomerase [Candidatus Woesearchaeota archaeon]|nr:triose-phosphate isomerase [Candidatus Woesearchaeota archaeon]
MIPTPVIVINFKTYEQSTGKKAVELAKLCEKVAAKEKVHISVAVQTADIAAVAKAVKIPVFGQHMDAIGYGAHTGHTLPEAVKQAGASGVMVNHSEYQLEYAKIKNCVERAGQIGLDTVVCAAKPRIAAKLAVLKPDAIAIEPPELIGGETSVCHGKPEIISRAVKMVHRVAHIPLLCGAGVKERSDAAAALKFGASGVLVASHIVMAKEPEKVLRELAAGIKDGC